MPILQRLNQPHVALWKGTSPRVAFLPCGWVSIPASPGADTPGAQTRTQGAGLPRTWRPLLEPCSDKQLWAGASRRPCSCCSGAAPDTQAAVSGRFLVNQPDSRGIMTQTPSDLCRGLSCYRGKGEQRGVYSFLSSAMGVLLRMWLLLFSLHLPALVRWMEPLGIAIYKAREGTLLSGERKLLLHPTPPRSDFSSLVGSSGNDTLRSCVDWLGCFCRDPGIRKGGGRSVACTAMDKGWPRGLLLTRKT